MSDGKRILLVDDEMCMLKLLEFILVSEGYQVAGVALNGRDAMAIFDSEVHDIVITDLHMPHMNGNELARWLREWSSRTKVLLFYGMRTGDDALEPEEEFFDGMVIKPCKPSEILSALAKVHSA